MQFSQKNFLQTPCFSLHNLFVERSTSRMRHYGSVNWIPDHWMKSSKPLPPLRYSLFRELAYLTELHEHILNLSQGSDIGQFLSWWDENSENLSLSSSKNEGSFDAHHTQDEVCNSCGNNSIYRLEFWKPGTSPLLWVSSTHRLSKNSPISIHIRRRPWQYFAAGAVDEYMRKGWQSQPHVFCLYVPEWTLHLFER